MILTRCPHPRRGSERRQCPYRLRQDPGHPLFCPTHGVIEATDLFELAELPVLFELAPPPELADDKELGAGRTEEG
jgi:hypothetical protein